MAKTKQVQVHQVFDSRYYDGVKLQRVLEKLFPNQNGDFGLRVGVPPSTPGLSAADLPLKMTNDKWAFKAPRQVTQNELVAGAGVSEEEPSAAEVHQFSTLDQIQVHFSRTETNEQPYHFISICQRQSWKPLQFTKPMLRFLIERFKLNPSIWDVASCFYAKDFDVESTFCIPFMVSRDGPITDISYTIRYPEFKPAQGTWVIRQSGIYQRFNNETKHNLCILFNPIPDSKFHQFLQDCVSHVSRNALKDIFWLHKQIFNTYLPSWRLYNVYLEKKILPIANKAVATWIEELTEAEYRHLTDLAYLESRLLQIPVILGSSNELLEGLSSLCRDWYPDSTGNDRDSAISALAEFKNHQLHYRAYVRGAGFLQKLAEKNTQLFANTLSFQEQLHAKAQNSSMLQLSKSAVFITTLTLLYLPASFIATFFGMNFFDLNDKGDQIVMTSMIWIYFLSSAALTICTFFLYHILLDKALLSRIKGHFINLKGLMHRSRKVSSDMESGNKE
ncbi:hypothetical protein FGADI_9825 [Fusarium gaditjirri]|uniref:Uncharacterized protein n=1 Tax=Fusarium gaditjirri TaxID=282569 RepID=A0A8H4WS09_9HYPO|nr:hypothetical protein FGADI_9825 [Fusarium gaditjirri]